jgi:hypothetical protein
LLLFSVLYGLWVANSVAFDGDIIHGLAAQVLALAEKQAATVPLMVGHRLKGATAMWTGNFAEGRAHLGKAIALYDPAEHRSLATRFGQDVRAAILFWRSPGLWMFGYPDAALADVAQALHDAREITHAGTLLFALAATAIATLFQKLVDGTVRHLFLIDFGEIYTKLALIAMTTQLHQFLIGRAGVCVSTRNARRSQPAENCAPATRAASSGNSFSSVAAMRACNARRGSRSRVS